MGGGGSGGVEGVRVLGGQGGCKWRSEAFVKIHFLVGSGGGGGWGWVWGGGGGQGGWERRIEDFVKIQKEKMRGGGSG